MTIIQIGLIVCSIFLIIFILLQSRGADVGGIFGGEGGFYRTKRGIEKFLFIGTIILAIVFFVLSVINVLQA